MQTLGSVAAVAATVREDAAAEVERLRDATDAAVTRESADQPPALDPTEREARLAAARREARERLAHEDALDAKAALEAREAWMRAVIGEARRRLPDYETAEVRRARLERLAGDALARLPDGRGSVADAPDGVRVTSADGRFTIDESLDARARRFEAAWRAALGKIWG